MVLGRRGGDGAQKATRLGALELGAAGDGTPHTGEPLSSARGRQWLWALAGLPPTPRFPPAHIFYYFFQFFSPFFYFDSMIPSNMASLFSFFNNFNVPVIQRLGIQTP